MVHNIYYIVKFKSQFFVFFIYLTFIFTLVLPLYRLVKSRVIESHSVSIITLRLSNDAYVNTDMSPYMKPLRTSYKFSYSQLTIPPTIYFTGPLWMSPIGHKKIFYIFCTASGCTKKYFTARGCTWLI